MKKQVKHLRMLWLLLLLVGGASLFESCVRTSQSDCLFPIRLRFEYVKNRENKDLFNAEVETLDLFLYDRVSGKLVDCKSPSVKSLKEGNVYEWYAPAGDYCVVAWAGNQGRYAYSGENSIDAAVAYAIRGENGKDIQQRHEHLFHARIPTIYAWNLWGLAERMMSFARYLATTALTTFATVLWTNTPHAGTSRKITLPTGLPRCGKTSQLCVCGKATCQDCVCISPKAVRNLNC